MLSKEDIHELQCLSDRKNNLIQQSKEIEKDISFDVPTLTSIIEQRKQNIIDEEYNGDISTPLINRLENDKLTSIDRYMDNIDLNKLSNSQRVSNLYKDKDSINQNSVNRSLANQNPVNQSPSSILNMSLIENGLSMFADHLVSSNPVSIAKKAKDYFDSFEDGEVNQNRPVTFTGLMLAIGFSSFQEFNEYEKMVGFSRIMKIAKLKCANYIEERIMTGEINSSAGQFLLKSIYEWRDNNNLDINLHRVGSDNRVPIDVEIIDSVVEELKRAKENSCIQ